MVLNIPCYYNTLVAPLYCTVVSKYDGCFSQELKKNIVCNASFFVFVVLQSSRRMRKTLTVCRTSLINVFKSSGCFLWETFSLCIQESQYVNLQPSYFSNEYYYL